MIIGMHGILNPYSFRYALVTVIEKVLLNAVPVEVNFRLNAEMYTSGRTLQCTKTWKSVIILRTQVPLRL